MTAWLVVGLAGWLGLKAVVLALARLRGRDPGKPNPL